MLNPQWVLARLGAGASAGDNRVLVHEHDAAGRLVRTTEPAVFHAWMEGSTRRSAIASAVTQTLYNAFGEAVRVSRLARSTPGQQDWQHTHHYFNAAGRRVASIDEGRFLTTFEHDSAGQIVRQVEYRTALAGPVDTSGYTAASAVDTAQGDRDTRWAYDALGRKIRHTRVGVAWGSASTATAITTTRGDLSTHYAYDAVGNLVRTTDAAGGQTQAWFDALGRLRATTAPTRTGPDGSALTPLVEYRHDAHGHVLQRIERVNTARDQSPGGWAVTPDSEDRITLTRHDRAGNALQVQDALGASRHQSFTVDGRLAKSWQLVSAHDGTSHSVYTVMRYDALGRLVQTLSPPPLGERTTSVTRETVYNAFGEVVARGVDGGALEEYYLHDNAGRLWKTNHAAGAGVAEPTGAAGTATVFLHDLLGRRTAEITSTGSGGVDVARATSAEQAAGWAATRRTDWRHDALGHVVEQLQPEREVVQGGITARAATVSARIVAQSTPQFQANGESTGYYISTGANVVRLDWSTLAYLGSGDVRVTLSYFSRADATLGWSAAARTIVRIVDGHEADNGLNLQWTDAEADSGAGYGVGSVTAVRVDKRDVDGQWVTVLERGHTRPWASVGTLLELGSPLDARTRLTLRWRLAGTAAWNTTEEAPVPGNPQAGLRRMGRAHVLDASGWAAGTYEY